MKKLNNLKIGVRLSVAFALLIVLLIGISVLAAVQLRAASQRTQELVNETYLKVELAHQLKDYANFTARQIRSAILARDADEVTKDLEQVEQTRSKYDPVVKRLDALIRFTEGRKLFEEMRAVQLRYRHTRDKVVDLIRQGQKDQAIDLMFGDLRKEQQTYFGAVDNLVTFQTDLMAESGNDAAAAARGATLIIVATALVAIVLGIMCSWAITRSVVGPAREAVESANRVADGDLTARIEARTDDEMGQLMQALQKMNGSLAQIIGGVRTSVETINSAASQIASENASLANRTEQQAASLEQTAASMTQLTETVKQNADNAHEAKALAVNASDIADTGHSAVQEMLGTIGRVNKSAAEISEITSLIEGIAFQTNILALNAAVEAARAGEQGRGFAVVASEVRSLAQRSSAAAKEIKEIIETSVGMIQDSARQAGEASASVEQIKQAVRKVLEIVDEISTASDQQTDGIEQVHTAVNQLDRVTQQNATLVEESAAAARSLEEQAIELRTAISIFKVDSSLPALRAA
ncbi:methyl-accepting chemotaxis protein [Paraburkholderia phymatum]|uniref:Methyl-accepting chemotaxis protein n=1 Tax=Paraburkholderia phymatum TaxID=148447 RepID=A0ACC6UD36_9BURK